MVSKSDGGESGKAGQRKDRRYKLEVPVRVKPTAPSKAEIEASSKDISAHGIYLVLSEELELGSELNLEITLPAELTGGENIKVICSGKVTRLEPRGIDRKFGIGAEIQNCDFSQINKALTNYSYKSWLA